MKTVDEQLRKMRLEYHKRMRENNEQSQGTVGEEADGQRQEEPGRQENVVEQQGVELHNDGGSGDLAAPEGHDPEAEVRPVEAPKPATKKKVPGKKG